MKRKIAYCFFVMMVCFNSTVAAEVINNPQYSGQQVINEKVYNYDSNGNISIGWSDGKYYNEFGFPEDGFLNLDDGRYYFIDGEPQKGLQKICNDYYYFNEKGLMCKGSVIGDYSFDNNGIGQPLSDTYRELDKMADEILKTTGTDIKPIYEYCVNHIQYKYSDEKDWTVMALESLKTGRGACYHRAALLDFMLKKAGYKTRVIWKKGTGNQQHYWNQVYTNGEWLNLDIGYKIYLKKNNQLNKSTHTISEIKYIIYK